MTNASTVKSVSEIEAMLRAGSIGEAAAACEAALAAGQDGPDLQCLYGFVLLGSDRTAEAGEPIKRAVSTDPSNPRFQSLLAEYQLKSGESEAAVSTLQSTVAANPAYTPAAKRLGTILIQMNRWKEAAESLDTALKADPGDHQTALILASALAAAGEYGGAYHVLDHAEKIRPDDPDGLTVRLEIARRRRDFSAMETLARRLTEVAPERPVGWRDLATAFFERGLYDDALIAFDKLNTLIAPGAEEYTQYAAIAMQALDFEKAEKALDRAEAVAPEHPRPLAARAQLLIYQGDAEKAEDYALRAIKADPALLGPYQHLSFIRKGRLDEDQERFVRNYARAEDIALGSRAGASFLAAQSMEARGEIDAAFSEFDYANRLASERAEHDLIAFDYEGQSAWTDVIISVFQGAEEIDYEAPDGPSPIFIVGLPRSGSTLLESVIGAHSKVETGGEMPMIPNLFNRWLKENHEAGRASLSADQRKHLAETYFRGIKGDAAKAVYVTDKNLLNTEAAGFIAQVFPNSPIINVRRNPVECCFSIWRQDMLKFWAFATDLENIARRYGLYAKLVSHFERVLLGRFITVQYEDFVGNFENGAKKLIASAGLDWEPQCAAFQKERAVAPTLSALQVREEVSIRSSRAEAYGARLDPLRRALEGAGVDLRTGALAQ
ncbi:MAG: sulfotransferase [Parvularculaceae bacterium]